MSMFRSSFTVSRQTTLPASVAKEDVLTLLHDHSEMITLNPIVIKHEQMQGPSSPPPSLQQDETSASDQDDIFSSPAGAKYSITDQMSYLPGHLWDGKIVYTAWFANASDGLRSFVRAPMGVEIRGSWRVIPSTPGYRPEGSGDLDHYLEERAVVSCNSLLRPFIQKTLDLALAQNKAWAYKVAHEDPSFFPKLGSGQSPEILWIGCADSRIPETTILGLKPGDVFVHRNIANILHSADINAGSVIEFAVKYLKVKHIIVCGHTSCGGVNAALGNQKLGMIDTWLLPLRQLRMKHAVELEALPQAERTFRLAQLNVAQSLDVLKQNAVVIDAIKDRDLRLHGLIYNVGTGELTTLGSEGDDKEAKARIEAFRLE
ncbi:MAG: hypothetical protein Q9165_002185 [Trypethelium subeluteriae]